MLEITPDDIALLNESDLRSLVGRLCEADLKTQGLSSVHVTWGGHQNAGDGGIDVRVGLPAGTKIDGFIPKADTGFQVKREDLEPSKILAEMRPSDSLRDSIHDLVNRKGAYIIVSSLGSISDSSLRRRREAMTKAVKDLTNDGEFTLEFYDRTRIATWVRNHPALILWVRQQIGKAVQGWQSYGPWAYPQEGNNAEFILDEKVRTYSGRSAESGEGMNLLAAIQIMRGILRQPRRMVRLVGHSGVGKTCLVQALFDSRIGEHALDSSRAFYTNLANAPDPQPTAMVTFLVASRERGILVIDNCGSELHQSLIEACQAPESNVSIITVEYDIRDHQPEGTDVFTLKTASPELISTLVHRRFPYISQVDGTTIAKLSDGNARIAIALAGAVRRRESLAELGDDVLFQRLFHQKNDPNESLLRAAQACSLVYSFSVEYLAKGEQAELAQLGTLVGLDTLTMYANVAELKRRDLVQQRGEWRAVLPHALANRLASKALQNIPFHLIEEQFWQRGSERLLQSFSRRLSYLHEANEARVVVQKWLGGGGLLSNVSELNEVGIAMFKNVAPVEPELALATLEKHFLHLKQDVLPKYNHFVEILRAIAYEPVLFERAAMLLSRISEAENVEESVQERNHSLKVFISLFYARLSGTNATVEQRLRIIELLLLSDDAKRRVIGLRALKAMLKTSHFDAWIHEFEFGAHSRNYGYEPRGENEIKHWFGSAVMLVEKLVCSDCLSSSAMLLLVAEQFRGLWIRAEIFDQLKSLCCTVSIRQFWPEGWLSVRRALNFQTEVLEKNQLLNLESLLRPVNLAQNVQANVFSITQRNLYDHHEGDNAEIFLKRIQQTQEYIQELGKSVAENETVFHELLPQMIREGVQIQLFGCGLARGAHNPRSFWLCLVDQFTCSPAEHRSIEILVGFIGELYLRDSQLTNVLLDNTLATEELAPFYPRMQTAVPIDEIGAARLLRSLEVNNIPAAVYQHLAYGRAAESISGEDFKALVLGIAAKKDGIEAAVEIVHMRLHTGPGEMKPQNPTVLEAGRELLRQMNFKRDSAHENYAFGEIAKASLAGNENVPLVLSLCKKLKKAVKAFETSAFYHRTFLASLFIVQPTAMLNGLLGDSDQQVGLRVLDDICDERGNPLDAVSNQEVLQWCDKEPAARYPLIAKLVTISISANQNEPQKLTDTALLLLEKAPDRIAVLKEFVQQLTVLSGWVGSFSATLEVNLKVLDELVTYPDPAVVGFIAGEKVRIQEIIDTHRQREQIYDKQRDERFE